MLNTNQIIFVQKKYTTRITKENHTGGNDAHQGQSTTMEEESDKRKGKTTERWKREAVATNEGGKVEERKKIEWS